MRELNTVELSTVGGAGDLTREQRLIGALWGVLDGGLTGAAVAGKVSGSGSFITGAINQLVSAAIGFVSCGFSCGVEGFNNGRDAAAVWAAEYRASYGGANQGFASV